MVLRSTQTLMSRGIFLGLNGGQHIRLTSPPIVNQMFKKCESLDISQPYGPPQSITGTDLPYFVLQSSPSLTFL
jgi:hypothetical protein